MVATSLLRHRVKIVGRRRDNGIEKWNTSPRPADTDTWAMKGMIEAHQDSVRNFAIPGQIQYKPLPVKVYKRIF